MAETELSLWQTLKLRRNIVALMAFLGFLVGYTIRVNLSVAIVSMTQNYSFTAENGTVYNKTDFDWNPSQKGQILSAFFYGYIMTQLFGGWLGAKFGGGKVICIGLFITALLALVSPIAANIGVVLFIIIRVLQGIFEGAMFPCNHAIWANWSPPHERTRLSSFTFSGSFFGTVVTFPVCGFLADKFGWQATFYIPGALTIIWCIVWLIWISDYPEEDRWITESELQYLQETLGQSKRGKQISYPWKEFFKSMPVWAIISSHFCENWGFYTMLTLLPSYITNSLHYDVQMSGFLSALPFLLMSITLQIGGIFVDFLRKKEIFTTTQVRKIFNCGAFLIQTVFMLLTIYATSALLSIILITVTIGIGAFTWTAFGVNHLDIAPQHASVLMGISSTFATTSGILGPTVAGRIIKHETQEEWNLVFFIIAFVYFFGAVFYGIFGSGEVQWWAKEEQNS